MKTLQQHRGAIQALRFVDSGSGLVSAGRDNVLRLWAVESGLIQRHLGHRDDIYSISLGPVPGQWISASADGSVRVWTDQGEIAGFRGEKDAVYQARVSPDGRYIVSGGYDNETDGGLVELWDAQGQKIRSLGTYGEWVISVAFGPDSQTVAAAAEDGTVYLLDLEGNVQHTLTHGDQIFSLVFSPDGQQLAVAGEGGVKIWETASYKTVEEIRYPASVYQVDYSPAGDRLAFAAGDGAVGLWGLDTGELTTLEGHTGEVYAVEFSPDGEVLASAGADKTIRLWQRSGDAIASWSGHGAAVLDVKFLDEGRSLVSASYDDTLITWDLSILDLDRAMAAGCDWLQGYIATNPESDFAQQGTCKGQ